MAGLLNGGTTQPLYQPSHSYYRLQYNRYIPIVGYSTTLHSYYRLQYNRYIPIIGYSTNRYIPIIGYTSHSTVRRSWLYRDALLPLHLKKMSFFRAGVQSSSKLV